MVFCLLFSSALCRDALFALPKASSKAVAAGYIQLGETKPDSPLQKKKGSVWNCLVRDKAHSAAGSLLAKVTSYAIHTFASTSTEISKWID